MNEAQVRHAKAMARKIADHAQLIVNSMTSLNNAEYKDFENVPLKNIQGRFTHDMGYGVQDHTTSIQRVITDMLPELENQ